MIGVRVSCTCYVWSSLQVLGPDGDLVAGIGLQASQGVPEHPGLDDLHFHIVDADGVHEVGVGRDPGHCARGTRGTSGFHSRGSQRCLLPNYHGTGSFIAHVFAPSAPDTLH